MAAIFRFCLRLVFFAVGLVLACGLLALALLIVLLWVLRAAWGRLRGRPVQPLAFTVLRRYASAGFARASNTQARSPAADVIDVQARPVATPADQLPR